MKDFCVAILLVMVAMGLWFAIPIFSVLAGTALAILVVAELMKSYREEVAQEELQKQLQKQTLKVPTPSQVSQEYPPNVTRIRRDPDQ